MKAFESFSLCGLGGLMVEVKSMSSFDLFYHYAKFAININTFIFTGKPDKKSILSTLDPFCWINSSYI